MRQFRVHGKIRSWTFLTGKDWRGLWAPLDLIGHQFKADENYPKFNRWESRDSISGESYCRMAAENLVTFVEERRRSS